MKKDYSKAEYRILKELSEPENIETGENPAPVVEDYSHINLVITLCVVLLAVSLLVCGIAAVFTKISEKEEAKNPTDVLLIDGEVIEADFYRLIVAQVIEKNDFSALSGDAKVKAIRNAADSMASEMIAIVHTAVDNGFVISEETRGAVLSELEESVKAEAKKSGKSVQDYYFAKFGVTIDAAAKYTEYYRVSTKYLEHLSLIYPKNEMVRKAYEEYKTQFASAEVTMIYFDMSSSDEGVNGFTLSKANTVFNSLVSETGGTYYIVNETDFLQAIAEWSSKNDLYDTSSNPDGKVHLDGTIAKKYPVLFETTSNMQIGEARLIVDSEACYIVRIDGLKLFDSCKDNPELISLAFQMYLDKVFEPVRSSERFTPIQQKGYSYVDVLSINVGK